LATVTVSNVIDNIVNSLIRVILCHSVCVTLYLWCVTRVCDERNDKYFRFKVRVRTNREFYTFTHFYL